MPARADSVRPNRRRRLGARFTAFSIPAALLLSAAPAPSRPQVMLMTGLPLIWGEKGPFDPGSRPAAAYVDLQRSFAFKPVDVLDAPTLGRGRLLLLAQPQRLAPSELVELDGWIRKGGRALIFADPSLTWPSELPPGDIRRPPPAHLLSPLLDHWGLEIEPPTEAGAFRATWNGRRLRLESPGRLRSSTPACAVSAESWTAVCRLGRGMARIVADADLLSDPSWTPADNPAIVTAWIDELAGVKRPAPPPPDASLWAALAVGAILASFGVAWLLRRRRRS